MVKQVEFSSGGWQPKFGDKLASVLSVEYKTPDKFGQCHECGEEIGFERLDALPHARLCIKCKAKEEDGKRR